MSSDGFPLHRAIGQDLVVSPVIRSSGGGCILSPSDFTLQRNPEA